MMEMKNSGVSWIGYIPIAWNVRAIGYGFEVGSGSTPSSTNVDYWDGDVPWVTPADFKTEDKTVSEGRRFITKKGYSSCGTRLVKEGSIIFSKRAPIGSVVIAAQELCTNQGCFWCTPKTTDVDSVFFYYTMSVYPEVFNLFGSGTTFKEISADTFKNIKLPLPSYDEQCRIADFLDKKCAEIDSLTADVQKEIETLQEYRRSLITEAVTKGLDPDVEMKDSGVEWIEEIPKSWCIERLKDLFSFSKGLSITKENLVEEGLEVISYGQIHSKMNNIPWVRDEFVRYVDLKYSVYSQSKVGLNNFVFADTSEDYEGCGNNILNSNLPNLYAGYHTIIAKSKSKNHDNRFLSYLFMTDLWRSQLRTRVGGIKVYSITQSILKCASVLTPPSSVQQSIVEFLDSKCAMIDSIIADKQKQLDNLVEFRKSLIYEYVTGKKEVV